MEKIGGVFTNPNYMADDGSAAIGNEIDAVSEPTGLYALDAAMKQSLECEKIAERMNQLNVRLEGALGRIALMNVQIDDLNASLTKKDEEISELNNQIITDHLTDCYNARYWERFCETNFNPYRDDGRLALVCVDINDLKKTNDELGRAEGDKLIVKMAEFLKENLRSEDIIMRLGEKADEFLAVCRCDNNCDDFAKALTFRIERRRTGYDDVRFAFGVALYDMIKDIKYDDDGELDKAGTLQNSFRRAEVIMRSDKEQRKNAE